MACSTTEVTSRISLNFTITVLVLWIAATTMASSCVPTPPCRHCDYVTIERDDFDCKRYYYCYQGRLWLKMRCGFKQIYSLKAKACVYESSTDECTDSDNGLVNSSQTPPTLPPDYHLNTILKVTAKPNQANPSFQAVNNYDVTCGVKATSHIVGGASAEPGEWGWQASLRQYSTAIRQYVHYCGATLVDEMWVVTAAHCVHSRPRVYLQVVFGAHNLSSPSPDEQTRSVAAIVTNPGYRSFGNFPNDIALLYLSSPVTMSRSVGTACLPPQGQNAESLKPEIPTETCWVTGWGHTLGTSDLSSLNEVALTLMTHEDCVSKWSTYIMDTHLCAGTGDIGACKGDSGGPLVCTRSGRYYLQGVVSWGEDTCTLKGYPNVFTRVASYSNWIRQTINSRQTIPHK